MRWHWALENKHSFDHTETMENTTYSYTFASLFAYHYIPDVSQRAVETGDLIIVKPTTCSTECLLQQILQQGADSAKPFPA